MKIEKIQKLWDALDRIRRYETARQLSSGAETDYGLEPSEALEYAYENIRQEAKNALRGVKRPELATLTAAPRQGEETI